MVKTNAKGLWCDAKEVYTGVQELPPKEKLFVYLLWLTGARTNEVARMVKENFFMFQGEVKYRVYLSKIKGDNEHVRPLVLFPGNEYETKMKEEVVKYVNSLDQDARLFPEYVPHIYTNRWFSKKDNCEKTNTVSRFLAPYNKIVRNKNYQVVAYRDNGKVVKKIPLHWIRSFVITNRLSLTRDPLFVQSSIGHKRQESTFRYWTQSGLEFQNRREEILRKIKKEE